MSWRTTRTLPLLLAAATLIPIGVLSWLGIRILEQDREVERQRRRDALEVAAGRLALDVERRLQEVEEHLARGAGIVFSPDGLTPAPDLQLLYARPFTVAAEVPLSIFSAGEAAEFQRGDLAAAASAYQRLVGASDPAVRAAALVRSGRVHRKRGDRTGALEAYAELEQLGTVMVAGQPAALVARLGRCRVFEEAGDAERLRHAAGELGRALDAGGWPIDRPTFELYRDLVTQWGGPPPAPAAVARTEAALRLWQSWRAGDLPPRGRRVVRGDTEPVLAVWTGGAERPVIWLATPGELEASWRSLWDAQDVVVALSDMEGHLLLGEMRPAGVSLMPGDTRLPFVVSLASLGLLSDGRERTRRAVLVSGLLVTFALMLAAAYGIHRTTARELGLARQQADFVSAVSHEFRTPLTSMRHLTELLASRGVASEERRAHYYELLAHETERLHRLVEGLLSFGRMEAGAYAWRLEPVDAADLVGGIVEEFRREPEANGRQILCEIETGLPLIEADAEALSRALWNLLENAAKYSEPDTPIRVFVRRSGEAVQVGVDDQGFGIGPQEREKIFEKFVRGGDARRAGIRGVGIGLALVKRIVEAHGGTVRVISEPGRGSTFTLVLPLRMPSRLEG